MKSWDKSPATKCKVIFDTEGVQYSVDGSKSKRDRVCPEPNNFPKRLREKKPHRRWCTTGSDYKRWGWGINKNLSCASIGSYGLYDGVGPIFERQTLPEIFYPKFHTRQRRKTTAYHDKVCKSTQKWADDDHQDRQTTVSNQQSTRLCQYFRSLATRLCKYYCRSCSTRGEILAESFACSCPWLTKLTVPPGGGWYELTRLKIPTRNTQISEHPSMKHPPPPRG